MERTLTIPLNISSRHVTNLTQRISACSNLKKHQYPRKMVHAILIVREIYIASIHEIIKDSS